MKITYQVRGLQRLLDATQAAPGEIDNQMVAALQDSVALLKTVTVRHTHRGPGHFGFHLADRWITSVDRGFGSRRRGLVGTDAPQGIWDELGTRPHEIVSRSGGLAFQEGGRRMVVASVQHPGAKPQHTLRNALREAKPRIIANFAEAVNNVIKTMAGAGD